MAADPGLASPWRRLGSTAVDTLAQLLALFVVQSALFLAGVGVGAVASVVLAQLVWLAIQLRLARGQTFGMQAVGIHAVRADGPGLPGAGRALVRWAVPAAFAVPAALLAEQAALGGAGIGADPAGMAIGLAGLVVVYAGVFTGPRRQGLHDRLSGVVVRLDDEVA